MKLTSALVATATLATLATLTACTFGSSEKTQESSQGDAPAAADPGTVEAPIELVTDEGESTMCFRSFEPLEDGVAWTAAQVRVLRDGVDSVTIDVEGDGIRSQEAYVVRPTNFGGRFDVHGTAYWADRRGLLSSRQYAPDASFRDTDESWVPTRGENVQVIARLRLAEGVLDGRTPGRITAVTATWQGEDPEESGTLREPVEEHWAVAPGCKALPDPE